MIRRVIAACCLTAAFPYAAAIANEASLAPSSLKDYVSRPETDFAWKLRSERPNPLGVVYDVELTSQRWQDIVWKHDLLICEPRQVDHPRHVLLLITGGANGRPPRDGEIASGMKLAQLTGARVAMLFQVPNQPLFEGRVEDDLITETWLRYLDTGDETWPLLFPMVKSAVQSMNAVEQLAKDEWDTEIDGFVVTGGSKRGWTSWLAPAIDKRIVATAPMVIDVLNFRPQMQHQLDSWGKYSEQIIDYSSKGLINTGEESPREERLRLMMDPYGYRHEIGVPKLLVNGTNDRYWVVDAMKLYWFDLVGPKYVLHVPNAGHGLESGRENVLATVAAFFRHTATSTPLPELNWQHENGALELVTRVTSSHEPTAARLWIARSPNRDFREARWSSEPLVKNGGDFVGKTEKRDRGHVARFAELQFQIGDLPYSLCTLIQCD